MQFLNNTRLIIIQKIEKVIGNLHSCLLEMKPPKCYFFHGWHVEYVKIQFENETYFCHFWKWLHCHERITSPAYRYYKPFVQKLLNFHENSISLEAFFSGHKTANEMGSPELHFGCKIKIYASERHLVTK